MAQSGVKRLEALAVTTSASGTVGATERLRQLDLAVLDD